VQFDLVCGRESLVELAMFINNMGAIFGNLFFSRLADMFGRKTIFLLCLWSNIPVAMSQAFAPSLLFYICMSFIDGAQQEVL
jgi:MFS family permease